jgi:hypothetical protein
LPLIYICRGYNWARVVLVAFVAIDLPFLVAALTGPVSPGQAAEGALGVIGALLLLLPSSNAWFRARRAHRQRRAVVAEPVASRPAVLTAVALVQFAAGVFLPLVALSDFSQKVGAWYPPYLIFTATVSVASAIGVWRLRRWGAYTYMAFISFDLIVDLTVGTFIPWGLVVPGLVIVVLLTNFQSLR